MRMAIDFPGWVCPAPSCETMFRYRADIDKHLRSSHRGERHVTCKPGCDEVFTTYDSQNKHALAVHRTKFYKCKECVKTKEFATRYRLTRHKQEVHTRRRFACVLCHLKFKQRGHLKRHLRQIHHHKWFNTWEPESNILDQRLLDEFEDRCRNSGDLFIKEDVGSDEPTSVKIVKTKEQPKQKKKRAVILSEESGDSGRRRDRRTDQRRVETRSSI
ncbi:testis-specific zinc finger protein topi-like isoform X3 [Bolinopsis microptera]|uniref:testis-specific zinc finger protein topi-like isoform X3 n=1 Tax=Bolinopsis microptera TaxID=2820187 RepID=UPI0030792346